MSTPHTPPLVALRAIRKLGRDIRDARIRRGLTMALTAERAFISRTTLTAVEQGRPGVSIGVYAAVLHGLGLLTPLADLADLARDPVGLALASEALPKRVRARRSPPGRPAPADTGETGS